MPTIIGYHRPESIDEAVELLSGPSQRQALGGGTLVVPAARVAEEQGTELVDLQGLGIAGIRAESNSLVVGAMTRVADLAGASEVPDLIQEAARRELPSALRNQATVGGTVAAGGSTSLLLAALLAHGATVRTDEQDAVALGQYLASPSGHLIVEVTVLTAGTGAIATTGRTPADEPIVAAVANRVDTTTLVLGGVANSPIVVDPDDPVAGLDPPGDFRGSTEYRLHLATTLSRRAIEGSAS